MLEAKLKELELVISDLEKGDLTLAGRITVFNKGKKLHQECQELLKNLETEVENILEESDR